MSAVKYTVLKSWSNRQDRYREPAADTDFRTVSQLKQARQMDSRDQLMVMAIKMLDRMEMVNNIRYHLRY